MKLTSSYVLLALAIGASILTSCSEPTQVDRLRRGAPSGKQGSDWSDQTNGGTSENDPELESPNTYIPLDQPWSRALVDEFVRRDREKRGADAAYYKYTYIPEPFLSSRAETNYARIGILKALNSVALDADDILAIEDTSGHGLVFAIDIRQFLTGDSAEKWKWIADGRPIDLGGGGNQDLAAPLRLAAFDPDAPVPADRLAYNMMHGGIYTALMDTVLWRYDFEEELGVGPRTATLAFEHGITFGVRYGERRTFQLTYKDGQTKEGVYWITYDPFDPRAGGDTTLSWTTGGGRIPNFTPRGQVSDFKSNVAAESYSSMKNGLFAYYVWGEGDQRRSRADPRFVVDPLHRNDANEPQDVLTGFCANCHVSGVQGAYSGMASAIRDGVVTNKEAIDFWTSNEKLSEFFASDRAMFKEAMKKIVMRISDGDATFNGRIVAGVDPKEPMYYLSRIIGKHSGDTTGLTRRREDGVVPGLEGEPPVASTSIGRPLTFAGDVLPILSSTAAGRNYRCVNCHSSYQAEASLDPFTLDAILTRVKLRYMPIGNGVNYLTPEDVGILEAWKLQKFGN